MFSFSSAICKTCQTDEECTEVSVNDVISYTCSPLPTSDTGKLLLVFVQVRENVLQTFQMLLKVENIILFLQ